ncbi:hypothetical protein F8M41_007723 [Gigaspora margarita]|uniref:Uncharacterized protein n=1 Tax=Gigaspora margarita TaxID=4874 RepID=A0A8H4AW47_GIGMA|nr:hypothetical protein F8M41_007723 [Gigaspora margarita]
MCSALIAAFSRYGLYSIATKLGIRFLDKLEQYVDYCATCKTNTYHYNADMQLKSLVAFALLFLATSKNIYTSLVVTFLESVLHSSQQYGLFKHVASVNITREYHYLAFDKALKQYGVKFVKQNLISDLPDPEILKQKIISIQDKCKRILLLYDKFVEDNIVNTENHVVKQYTETL